MTKLPITSLPHMLRSRVDIVTFPHPSFVDSILLATVIAYARSLTKERPIRAKETQRQNFELLDKQTGSLPQREDVRLGASAAILPPWVKLTCARAYLEKQGAKRQQGAPGLGDIV